MAAIGAIVALPGSLLPWYTVGGDALPALMGHGLDGASILVFIAAVGTLALLILPYAAGDQPTGLDRALSFVVLLGIGVFGLVVRLLQLLGQVEGNLGSLGPGRGPGVWLAAGGLGILAWAVADIATEGRRI